MDSNRFESRKRRVMGQPTEEWMLPEEEKAPAKPVQPAVIAGLTASILVFAIQAGLQLTGRGSAPTGLFFAYKILGIQDYWMAMLIGTLLFCLAGAAWAVLYVLVMPEISSRTGLLFSILPWLVWMLVIFPILDRPTFADGDTMGMFVPLALCLLWGSFVGAFTPILNRSRLRDNT